MAVRVQKGFAVLSVASRYLYGEYRVDARLVLLKINMDKFLMIYVVGADHPMAVVAVNDALKSYGLTARVDSRTQKVTLHLGEYNVYTRHI
jgi:hypothetical protein